MAMLEIGGLRKTFGSLAVLDGLDLVVEEGECVALLGASGSGKTTLLRIVAGFERPNSGTIAVGGRTFEAPGVSLAAEGRGLGYMAQDGALFPHLTVAQNIGFGLGRFQRLQGTRVRELLAMVGLPASYLERAPQQLSGGEQQRVALARALARRPQLVLMDEPFSALDPTTRAETRDAVIAALRRSGATALIITHDQAEAYSVAERVGVLSGGSIAQIARPHELYWSPVTQLLAKSLGDAVLVPGFVADDHVICCFGRLALRHPVCPGSVDVMVRPEQLELWARPSVPQGRVIRSSFLGPNAYVELMLPFQGEEQRVVARASNQELPVSGDSVGFRVSGPVMAYPRNGKTEHVEECEIADAR